MKPLMVLLAFLPIAAGFPSFWVPDQQYRFGPDDERCSQQKRCFSEEAPDHSYSLNFIEIRDSGRPFDPAQLQAAKDQLRKARADGQKPTVFIYVHGWHNNAGERDQPAAPDCADKLYVGDVDKFRHCGLEVLAKQGPPPKEKAAPRVVGIYLAWHGTDFGWMPFYIIPSYPFRRHFGKKVGLAGMADALQGLLDVIEEDRDAYFVITMGHSFGARVLENAVNVIDPQHANAGILEKYRMGVKRAPANSALKRLPVDLVFYVNAATSHAVTIQTIEHWKETCTQDLNHVGCDKDPLYLAVSSRADALTAIVLPIANVVFFAPATDQYHLIAAANTPWLQTHKIPKPVDNCDGSETPDAFCFGIPESETAMNYHRSDPKKGEPPAMFWALNSDHWIASLEGMLHKIPVLRRVIHRHWVISSHGDVWNTGVFNLVNSVIDREEIKVRAKVAAAQASRAN